MNTNNKFLTNKENEKTVKKLMFFEKHAFDQHEKPSYPHWIVKYLYETGKYEIKVIVAKPFDKSKYNLPIFKFRGNFSFFKEFLEFKPDILVVFQTFGPRPIAFIKIFTKLTNTKVIVCPDFTPIIFKMPFNNPFIRAIKNMCRYVSMWFQAKTADYLVCWTEFEKKEIQQRFKINDEKFKIIPLGFEFRIGPTNKENYILSVAQWTRRKCLHTIISVFNEVAKENKNIKLIVVGKIIEEGYDKEIEKKLMKLDTEIKKRIEFTGPIFDRNKLEELYKRAKIFYLPSAYESFGMVFVEAMSSGTPVIAYPASATLYVIKDGYTGFLCKTEDEQKEAILKLLNDEKLYVKMQKNCLNEAEKYKWENIIKKWIEIIER